MPQSTALAFRAPSSVASVTEQSDWASQLSAAVRSQFGARPRTVELYSVTTPSSEVVEIVHSDPAGRGLRGIRIDQTSVLSARERISDSSIDELARRELVAGASVPLGSACSAHA